MAGSAGSPPGLTENIERMRRERAELCSGPSELLLPYARTRLARIEGWLAGVNEAVRAYERVGGVPREQSDALAEALDFLIDLPHHPSLLTDEDYVTIEGARKALNSYREATSE